MDLITLDDYKVLAGLTGSEKDEKLESLITKVSRLVKTYCGTSFLDYAESPGITDTFDIQWPTYVVQLTQAPVIAIQSVYERTSQSEAYTQLYGSGNNDGYDWYFDPVTDSVFRTVESGAYKNWPRGVGAVRVTYTAGYATVPGDVQLAVSSLVTYYDQDEYKIRQSLGTASMEGNATSTVNNDFGFPDHIRRVLDLYRNL